MGWSGGRKPQTSLGSGVTGGARSVKAASQMRPRQAAAPPPARAPGAAQWDRARALTWQWPIGGPADPWCRAGPHFARLPAEERQVTTVVPFTKPRPGRGGGGAAPALGDPTRSHWQ